MKEAARSKRRGKNRGGERPVKGEARAEDPGQEARRVIKMVNPLMPSEEDTN